MLYVVLWAELIVWIGISILLICLGRTSMLDGFTALVLEIGAVFIGIMLSLYFMCEIDAAFDAFVRYGLS